MPKLGQRIRPNVRLDLAQQPDYLAELWQTFGVTFVALHMQQFVLTTRVYLKSLYCNHCSVLTISY